MKRYFQIATGVVMIVMGCGLAFSSCSYSILRDGSHAPASITAFVGIFATVAGVYVGLNRLANERFGIFLDGLALFGIYGAGGLVFLTNTFFALGPAGKPAFDIQSTLIAGFFLVSVFSLLLRFFLNRGLHPVTSKRHRAILLIVPVSAVALFVGLNWAFAEDRIVLGDGREIILKSHGFPLLAMQAVQTRRISENHPKDKRFEIAIELPDSVTFGVNSNAYYLMLPGLPVREIKEEKEEANTFIFPDLTRVSLSKTELTIRLFRQTPIHIKKETGGAVFSNGITRIWKTDRLIGNVIISCLLGVAFFVNVAVRMPGAKTRRPN